MLFIFKQLTINYFEDKRDPTKKCDIKMYQKYLVI